MKLTGFHVLDISFVDAKHGFALGAFEQPHMAVLRTDDGGRTWKTVTTPPEAVAHIEFSTKNLGWVFGPNLYVTRDGGHTWVPEAARDGVLALAAAPRGAWAVERSCGGGRCSATLLKSRDGGTTWRNAGAPLIRDPSVGIVWADGSRGWVWSFGPGRPPNDSRDHLLATTDGGDTWKRAQNPCSPEGLANGQELVPDRNELWFFCAGEASAGSQWNSLARSTDGGTSWTTIFDTAGACCFDDMAVVEGRVLVAQSFDAAAGLMAFPSARGLLLDLNDILHWGPLEFADARHGWLGADENVYRTDDGGRHWEAVRLKPTGCG